MSFYNAALSKLRTYSRHAGPDQIVQDFILPLAKQVDNLTIENAHLKQRVEALEGPREAKVTFPPHSHDDLAAGGVL